MEDQVLVIGDVPAAAAAETAVTIDEASENPLPRHATLNEDGSVSLPLHYPVTLEWKRPGSAASTVDRFDTLTMYRLTGKEMMTLGAATREEVGMLSICLSARQNRGIFRHVYAKMDGADIQAAAAVVTHFLGNGPATGR